MSSVSFSNNGINVNTGQIAASSKRQDPPKNAAAQDVSPVFRREVPFTGGENFVEIDGKRYNLNAPRGTYLDISV